MNISAVQSAGDGWTAVNGTEYAGPWVYVVQFVKGMDTQGFLAFMLGMVSGCVVVLLGLLAYMACHLHTHHQLLQQAQNRLVKLEAAVQWLLKADGRAGSLQDPTALLLAKKILKEAV
ncbi:uncharacterized protein LOC129600725 [Paramacrobiotus metropolitanus]|uniref:uncharacterized protein LOC129600725 n=1 Tax=Paramacrobiotus metropolitanus TaxID=2943436 RepID=UPI00244606B8|nr:uncharacterized protein LOC129600725 [Paramacrobiotus metropolitanus]